MCAPLLKQIQEIKEKVRKEVSDKCKDSIDALNSKYQELEKSINELDIQSAEGKWHPSGTVVTLWEAKDRWSKVEKSNKTFIHRASSYYMQKLLRNKLYLAYFNGRNAIPNITPSFSTNSIL